MHVDSCVAWGSDRIDTDYMGSNTCTKVLGYVHGVGSFLALVNYILWCVDSGMGQVILLAKIQNWIDGVHKIRENLESSYTGFWGARDSDRHPQTMQTVQ